MNLVTYIYVAGGSPDPAMNATLATVLKKAKADGVPKENIDKALARVNALTISKWILLNTSQGLWWTRQRRESACRL